MVPMVTIQCHFSNRTLTNEAPCPIIFTRFCCVSASRMRIAVWCLAVCFRPRFAIGYPGRCGGWWMLECRSRPGSYSLHKGLPCFRRLIRYSRGARPIMLFSYCRCPSNSSLSVRRAFILCYRLVLPSLLLSYIPFVVLLASIPRMSTSSLASMTLGYFSQLSHSTPALDSFTDSHFTVVFVSSLRGWDSRYSLCAYSGLSCLMFSFGLCFLSAFFFVLPLSHFCLIVVGASHYLFLFPYHFRMDLSLTVLGQFFSDFQLLVLYNCSHSLALLVKFLCIEIQEFLNCNSTSAVQDWKSQVLSGESDLWGLAES
jgi:hypothetical protein